MSLSLLIIVAFWILVLAVVAGLCLSAREGDVGLRLVEYEEAEAPSRRARGGAARHSAYDRPSRCAARV